MEVARSVRVLRADDATIALELRLGEEEWLVVDDTSGKALALAGLEAQLRYSIVRAEPDVAPYVFASGAR